MAEQTPKKIVIIEDDAKYTTLIATYLEKFGFHLCASENGVDGLALVAQTKPDLIVLDLMLPRMDGLTVCRTIRGWYTGRIIILTASEEDMDQVAALEIGADDYVVKPVHPRVLLARIRALLRRDPVFVDYDRDAKKLTNQCTELKGPRTTVSELVYGPLSLQLKPRTVTLGGEVIHLTESEFELFWILASNPEVTLSRDELMMLTRGVEYDGINRSVDNLIVSLRRKLNDNRGLPKRILTVRNKGYFFVSDTWG